MSLLNSPIVLAIPQPNTCSPKNNISNIPRVVALRLRTICDDDNENFKKYLIARDHKPSILKKPML